MSEDMIPNSNISFECNECQYLALYSSKYDFVNLVVVAGNGNFISLHCLPTIKAQLSTDFHGVRALKVFQKTCMMEFCLVKLEVKGLQLC